MQNKVLTAAAAVQLIQDRAFVAIQGAGGGVAEPTALMKALGERYQQEQQPRDLTLCHATGLGDKVEIGCDYLAHPGLVKRDIAGHLGMAPKMAQLILDNQVECYNFPQGVLSQMYSTVAARKPGVFTKVGLHTYIDPRIEGGKMNAITTEDLVQVMTLMGEEWLFFPRFHINVALVRGTTADTKGNITSEEEAAIHEGIAIAQAAKACGGIVIAQVKYLAEAGTLDPRNVKIPGIYVDQIVVDPAQKQTCLDLHNPAFTGQVKIPLASLPPLPLDMRKVVARRAAQELFPGAVVNLGVGMPDGVAAVATETGLIHDLTLTVEHGIIGGMPAAGVIFGVAYNPEAIIAQDAQFNFYDGGGLDVSCLGMAQADAAGNVNVSKIGSLLTGCGGFINISQNAKKVVFCGNFTAKGLRCTVGNGQLRIDQEGAIPKFVERVDQITFSGDYARAGTQTVLYVTERAVFQLTPEGLLLKEIAPGVDLERDILAHMGFRPLVPDHLPLMDAALFT
ncbi:MAG: CoA-transferase [Caldilineaceae bacterium]